MKLEKEKYYFVKILRFGRELEYVFVVKEILDGEYKVLTKEGDILYFKDKEIMFEKEVSPFSFKKEVYDFCKNKNKSFLKSTIKPDFPKRKIL